MRRPSTLKNKRYLAGPYLFWSISFVVIPLLVVFYYAMTNDEGQYHLCKPCPDHHTGKFKGTWHVTAPLFREYSDLSAACLSACHDP